MTQLNSFIPLHNKLFFIVMFQFNIVLFITDYLRLVLAFVTYKHERKMFFVNYIRFKAIHYFVTLSKQKFTIFSYWTTQILFWIALLWLWYQGSCSSVKLDMISFACYQTLYIVIFYN